MDPVTPHHYDFQQYREMLLFFVVVVIAGEVEIEPEEVLISRKADSNLACYANAGRDCTAASCPVQKCLDEHNSCLIVEYTLATQIKLKAQFLCATMPASYADGVMKCCLDMVGTKDCRLYSSDMNSNNAPLFTDDISDDTLEQCFYANVSTDKTEEDASQASNALFNCSIRHCAALLFVCVLNILADNF